MNKRNIGYWITTGLVCLAFTGSGIAKLRGVDEIVNNMTRVGVSGSMVTMIGVWMIAAVVVLLAPKLPRLKEWAYAGVGIQMITGAAAHIAVGDPIGQAVPSIVLVALAAASYALRPASRTLVPVLAEEPTTAPA